MIENAIFKKYNSGPEGISQKEALLRLAKYGLNTISTSNKYTLIKNIAEQFTDFLVIILLIAAVISILLGDSKTSFVMFGIVGLNAVIGFAQQYKTERTMAALKNMLPHYSNVLRGGKEREIPSQSLVPGDLIIIQAGDSIPADGIITEEFSFKVNESSLTGESKAQAKSAKEDEKHKNINKVFAGTSVLEGEAKIIVIATGINTEFGKIAQKTKQTINELSPLQKKLRIVGKTVAKIAGTIMIAMIIYSIFQEKVLLHHTLKVSSFRDIFLFSLALAASLVPEGLPATVSVALSFGANRLIKKKAIVKKLAAVETLGSANVICTDKTGTLTIGKMSVISIVDHNGEKIELKSFDLEKSEFLKLNFCLCQNVQKNDRGLIGDADEIALWEAAETKKIDPQDCMKNYEKIHEFSFNPIRKMMSVLVNYNNQKLILSKGNPDIILKKCHLTDFERTKYLELVDNMARDGLRVFAFAHRLFDYDSPFIKEEMEQGLIFDGLAGMSDDIHPEVPKAIEYCQKAGIKIVMVTGDYKITAASIAEKINLFEGYSQKKLISGEELAAMSELELRNCLLYPTVFYQTDPAEKLRIVTTLQKMGMVVAVTGDGVNDSLALKKADIGIAMGKCGTDVAKEAADMVLLDDNFATIVTAIKEGRIIWNNLKKFVFYIFSSNAGEFMTVFVGLLFGLPSPLNAVQILSVDLGTDVLPSLALAADDQTKGVLSENIKKRENLLDAKVLKRLLIVGAIMGGGAALNFWLFNGRGEVGTERYFQATTVAWVTLVVCQIVNVFEVRGGFSNLKDSLFGNKYVVWSVLGEIMIMALVVYWRPLQNILGTRGLNIYHWLSALMIGAVFIVSEETLRRLFERKKIIPAVEESI